MDDSRVLSTRGQMLTTTSRIARSTTRSAKAFCIATGGSARRPARPSNRRFDLCGTRVRADLDALIGPSLPAERYDLERLTLRVSWEGLLRPTSRARRSLPVSIRTCPTCADRAVLPHCGRPHVCRPSARRPEIGVLLASARSSPFAPDREWRWSHVRRRAGPGTREPRTSRSGSRSSSRSVGAS